MNAVRVVRPVNSTGPIMVAYNSGITTTFEQVWGNSNSYTFRTAAATMTISSGSANDAAAGTGARTCRVTGIDANYSLLTETVTLNGQTGVTLANQYMLINSVEMLTAGSGKTNAGIIYVGTGVVTAGVPATVDAYMAAGVGVTQHGFRGIPTGYIYSIGRIFASTQSTTAGGHELKLRVQTSSLNTEPLYFEHPNTLTLDVDFPHPYTIAGPCIIDWQVKATGGTGPYCLLVFGSSGLFTDTF